MDEDDDDDDDDDEQEEEKDDVFEWYSFGKPKFNLASSRRTLARLASLIIRSGKNKLKKIVSRKRKLKIRVTPR